MHFSIYLLLVCIALRLLCSYIKGWRLDTKIVKLGCGPAPAVHKEWWDPLGILVIRDIFRARANHKLIPFVAKGFQEERERTGRVVRTMSSKTLAGSSILTYDPKNIQAVLATQFADYDMSKDRCDAFSVLLGNGIFSSNGARWSHSRSLIKPAFKKGQISDLSLQDMHCRNMMLALPTGSEGWTKPTDLQKLFYRFTMDTSTEMLFGESVNSQLYELPDSLRPRSLQQQRMKAEKDFAGAFDAAQLGLSKKAAFGGLHKLYNPEGYQQACKECHEFIDHYVYLALSKTWAEKDMEKDTLASPKYVFLDELARETRDPLELRSQLMSILLAGRDTTASLLGHLFANLARQPGIYGRLRAAIVADFGSAREATEVTFTKLKDCTYLQYCLNETLRLCPSVPVNGRSANKDTTLPSGGGPDGTSPIFIPEGTDIGFSVALTHLDTSIWGTDADKFKPERWTERVVPWTFLPFSGGPRICLGQQFALTSAAFATVRLLQRFDLMENLEPDPEGEYLQHLTLIASPANGVQVRLREAIS